MPPPQTHGSPSDSSAKRKLDNAHDPSISPPLTKRKIQSNVSKSAVASFFTPTSQKPRDPVKWAERAASHDKLATLLVGTYSSQRPSDTRPTCMSERRKVAAFDLDSTLIATASGKAHAEDASDWRWWHSTVPRRLAALYQEGYHVVVFSNQGGLKLHADPGQATKNNKKQTAAAPPRDRVAQFKQKVAAVLAQLDLPSLTVYAATGKDKFRKPRTGMWTEMLRDLGLHAADIDLPASFFVGDAGGRTAVLAPSTSSSGEKNKQTKGAAIAKDFSCSDRNLAANLGIAFHTPEEYFLAQPPRQFVRSFDLAAFPCPTDSDNDNGHGPTATRTPKPSPLDKLSTGPDTKEIIMFCGPPAAGKSSFFRRYLQPLHTYRRVNQDTLKTKDKCIKAAAALLDEGLSVVIDNTNPDPATRALWVDLAKKHGVPVRCLWFKTSMAVCEHNDAVRALNESMNPEKREALPRIAFNGFNARFKEPKLAEGFSEVVDIDFAFRGTKDEYSIWAQYWA